MKAFEDASGRDLGQFALWYHQAGTPNLSVAALHDASNAELTLEIEQSVPPTPSESRKRLMHIPLKFGLIGADGRDLQASSIEGAEVTDGVIHVRKRRHSIRFSGIAERPALSLNRGFSRRSRWLSSRARRSRSSSPATTATRSAAGRR